MQSSTYEYLYTDANAKPTFKVVCHKIKSYRIQKRIDGEWRDSAEWPSTLYNLHNVIAATKVYICCGESAADELITKGLVATTNSNGSRGWRKMHAEQFRNKHVVIQNARHQAGLEWTGRVYASVVGIAASVEVVNE